MRVKDQLRCSQNIDSCWSLQHRYWSDYLCVLASCLPSPRVISENAQTDWTATGTLLLQGFQTHQRPPADRRLQGFYQQMMLVCFLTDLLHEPAAPIPMRGAESGRLNWTRKEFWRNKSNLYITVSRNGKQMKRFCEIHPEVSNFAVKI